MVKFFRDVLDGPLYIVTTISSIIFIMAIIGFLMERKKLEKEKNDKIAVIDTKNVTPISTVTVEKVEESVPLVNPVSNLSQEENSYQEVKPPVIVFDDKEQKTE